MPGPYKKAALFSFILIAVVVGGLFWSITQLAHLVKKESNIPVDFNVRNQVHPKLSQKQLDDQFSFLHLPMEKEC